MSYLRFGTPLPSGKPSQFYIYMSDSGLENDRISEKLVIPKEDLKKLLLKPEQTVKDEVKKRLELNGEELEVVCERLFRKKTAYD